MVKDYEEMEQIIKRQIVRSRRVAKEDSEMFEGSLSHLKEGLTWLFMHPSDGNNGTLLALLRAEILNYTAFWKVVMDVTRDSLNIFQSSSYSALQRASHLYVVENVISYITSTREEEYHKVLDVIAKAKMTIPKSINSHRLMNAGHSKPTSPSVVARSMLRQRITAQKEKKKKGFGRGEKKSSSRKEEKSKGFCWLFQKK